MRRSPPGSTRSGPQPAAPREHGPLMKSLTISATAKSPGKRGVRHSNQSASHVGRLASSPLTPPIWNETELTDAILTVCDEIPDTRMVACWRALEHCRRSTPHGTPESLLAAVRDTLRRDLASHGSALSTAA